MKPRTPTELELTHRLKKKGHLLWVKIFPPKSKSECPFVFITHGLGDHSGCYDFLITYLTLHGIGAITWDLYGHGKSSGARGNSYTIQEYVEDLQEIMKFVISLDFFKQKVTELIFLSHSLGGLIQLTAHTQKYSLSSHRQVYLNPFWGLKLQPSTWKLSAAFILKFLLPQFTLFNEIIPEQLSGDPHFGERFKNDILRHNQISPKLFFSCRESQLKLETIRTINFKQPMLLCISDHDPIVSSKASQKLFEKFKGKKKIKIFKSAYHELHQDTVRNELFKLIKTFIVNR